MRLRKIFHIVKELFKYIFHSKELFLLYYAGHLKDVGWFKSVKEKSCVDKNGNPVPWLTYPFLDFINTKLNKSFNVFEYGCGNSTLWWADKVNLVVSCEHNKEWFEKINRIKPKNVRLIFRELDGNYSKEILNYQNQFEIIVIDGKDRVNCAKNSLDALKKDGIILWDNAERKEYKDGYDFLLENEFKKIDFCGMGPINMYKWCTALFYRERNCLGL